MFTPSDLEKMPVDIERRMSNLEISIMEDIVRRIKINGEITRSADWQLYRLAQLGESKEVLKEQIRLALNLSYSDIDKIYSDAIESGYVRDKALYDATKTGFTPFKKNKELQQLIQSVVSQTKDEMVNITQSMGFVVNVNGKTVFTEYTDYFQRTLDEAALGIANGTFDYNSTLKKVVNEMTKSGIRTINYASGRSDRVNVVARRALMTGVSQVTGKISETNAKLLDTDLFEVSWHSGARPDHQVWQGRVYTMAQLKSVCGYGTPGGLKGPNCRHDFYAFVEGASTRSYTDEELDRMNKEENTSKTYVGKEYTTYQALQRQRNLETLMRKQRQDIDLLKKGGADEEDLVNAMAKYRATSYQYSYFSEKMGLPEQRERVYSDTIGKVDNGKGVAKPLKSDIIKTDKQFGKKIGKHSKDYGLDPGKTKDRNKMSRIIDDIITNKDELVKGNWRGQEGLVDFYIKDSDVVVVNNGKFVTVLKGGIENARVKDARKRKI